MVRALAALALVVGLTAGPPSAAYAGGGPTVVSLDSCADQLILALAGDDQILALSPDARGPFSYYREKAGAFPRHDGTAEAILLYQPELVLGTGAGDGKLRGMLERLGIPVVSTGLAQSLDQALAQLEQAGQVLGEPHKAELLAGEARALRRELEAGQGPRRLGLYVSPSGITTGAGTFLDETLRLAGLSNLMAEHGVEGWSRFDLESFLAARPKVVVTSFFDSKVGHSEGWRFSAHPAVQRALKEVKVIDVPSRLLSCPAWYAIEGAAYIRARIAEQGKGGEE